MTTTEYNQCVDAYSDALFRFITKNLRDRDEAQNLVQDSFESLWLNKEKVEKEKCKAWLFTTGYRKMIDHIRRQQKVVMMDENFREPVKEDRHQPDLKKVIDNALS